jgi:hypothetical protein
MPGSSRLSPERIAQAATVSDPVFLDSAVQRYMDHPAGGPAAADTADHRRRSAARAEEADPVA